MPHAAMRIASERVGLSQATFVNDLFRGARSFPTINRSRSTARRTRRSCRWQFHISHSTSTAAGPADIGAGNSSEQASDLQIFLAWLRANGVVGVGEPDSKLAIFEGEAGSRGLLFVADAAAGEVLLKIPLRLALTDHQGEAPEQAGSQDTRLALKLLQQARRGEASPWHPFIQVLPRAVCSAFGCWPATAQAQLQLPTAVPGLQLALAAGREGAPEHGVSAEELRWALSVVHSRAFQSASRDGGLGVRMLVPLADFCNHAGDEAQLLLGGPSARADNVRWELAPPAAEGGGWEFRVLTVREAAAGEEALLCYGALAGWQLLLHSGFVPARNSHEAAPLFPNVAAAVAWFLDRFPPQGGPADREALAAAAVRAAEQQAQPLHAALQGDLIAVALHNVLQLTSRGEIDGRLMAALAFLVSRDPGAGSQERAEAKAERIVGLRIAELLHSPGVSSVLLDLQLLGSLADADEEERAHCQALQTHYAQVVERFEEECAAVKALAVGVSSAAEPPPLAEASEAQAFHEAGLLALRLRAAQKQVLWDGLEALLMRPPG